MTAQPETQVEGSTRFVDFALEPNDDGRTLEGYAAVFNTPSRIANRYEDFTETIAPGAFARAIRANPKPVMQFNHGIDPAIGANPIAAVQSMREDDRGLFVTARMLENWQAEPVREAIKAGAIKGMSFRFGAEGDQVEWSDDRDSRTVVDLDLYELGPVVFPQYLDTTVTVRSREFADAIRKEPDLLHDLSIGLLLANRDEPPDPDPESDPTPDLDESAPPVVADSDDEGVRVANPAKHAIVLMAVRTDLATQRSHLATHELSIR